jgi:hypothetical protein
VSASHRPRVRADFRLGPAVPGLVLPLAVGLLGLAASLIVLQDLLLVIGAGLSVVAAVRVRTAVPWLLIAVLAVGQLVRDPGGLDVELPALVLVLHLLVVLVLQARTVPVRARVQLAALWPSVRAFALVQVPVQALAAVLLITQDGLEAVPVASTVGALLLVLVAGLLVVPRSTGGERDQRDPP